MTTTPTTPTTSATSSKGHAGSAPPTGTATTPMAPMPVAPRLPGLRRRRRPGLLGLAVAMVAVGALLAVWLAAGTGAKNPVLAIARPVLPGEVITDADLAVARVATDPALDPIPAARRARVVGRRAVTDLVPGALLTSAQLTDKVAPGPGSALVGVAVRPSQLPGQALRPGDRLLVVSTPAADADLGTDPPATVPVTVVRVGAPDDTGLRVVDVTVVDGRAADLAARAATGRVALVLQPRDDQGGRR